MRYFWIIDRVNQTLFLVYSDKGANNLVDDFTKHHPPNYHQYIEGQYVLKGFIFIWSKYDPCYLRGCTYHPVKYLQTR